MRLWCNRVLLVRLTRRGPTPKNSANYDYERPLADFNAADLTRTRAHPLRRRGRSATFTTEMPSQLPNFTTVTGMTAVVRGILPWWTRLCSLSPRKPWARPERGAGACAQGFSLSE